MGLVVVLHLWKDKDSGNQAQLKRRGKALRYRRLQFSSVQSLSLVGLFASPWTAAHQASLSITNSQSLLKLMSIGGLLLAIGSLKCFYVCYCMLLRVVCVLLLCVIEYVCYCACVPTATDYFLE